KLPIFSLFESQQDGGDGFPGEGSGFGGDTSGVLNVAPWDGNTRVTMLIMGLDYRDWQTGDGPSRTDTMILLTIDPISKTAGVLSIPRDLWAVIPGFSPGKINTAYYFGELYQVPGGGPALAVKTVEQTLGVPIDYYAQVDFDAFVRFVDLLGGVKIDVPAPISVDPLGADNQRKNLEPGIQTLPGDVALAYARARNTPGGDFDRAARQQQVIIGLRDRILDFNLLPDLIKASPHIYNELIGGVDTNLPLEDAVKLAGLAAQIKKEDITRGIIDETYVNFGTSPDGLAILLPIPDRIRTLRDHIFADTGALGPLTPGSDLERMQLESARVAILNGTQDGSLGQRTADYLRSLGANIISVGEADTAYGQSMVIDYSGRPYTMKFLVDLFKIQLHRIRQIFNPVPTADVELYLGNDWLNSNPMP
ncbi:MAG: LCP family protein, partial [Anaerolineae bacterium]|nr:LCP family protein [Anaerolineae bacterium]